jgi:hypothetical protein
MSPRGSAGLVAALLLLATAAPAQTPAELAEREAKRRKGASPAPAYTNDDLSKGAKASPAPGKPGAAASTPSAGAAEAAGENPSASAGDEAYWRRRMDEARRRVVAAERLVRQEQERLNALMADTSPTNVMDPFRLQTLEADRAKAREAVEKATQEQAAAQKALEDLQEEARRRGALPGWLRES